MTLISITKAAEMMGISRATAYRLAQEGRIPCVRSLGPIRVHVEKLQEMIDAEADRSMAKPSVEEKATRIAHHPIGQMTNAQMEREFDDLLKMRLKPKKK